MKKFLLIFIALLIVGNVYGSRNSDDMVTASNSSYNNYIQDVIGNKGDTTNTRSAIGISKKGNAFVTNMQNDVDTANIGITNMQNNVDTIETTVTNVLSDITNLQNNVDTIETTVTNTLSDITNLQNSVDTANVGITNMQNNVDVIETTVTNILSDITNLQNNIDTIESTVTNTLSDITNLQNSVDTANIGITNMQNNMDTVETTVTNMLSDVTNMQNDVDTANIGITNMQNNVDTIELTVTNILSDITNLQNSVDTVNIGITNMQNNIDTITNVLTDITNTLETLEYHIHNQSRVWPTGAAGTNVVSDNVAWAATNYTNGMVPCNTITSPFDIHYLCIEAISANGVYEIILYNVTGAPVEIGRVRVVKNANQDGTMNVPIQTPIQDANSCIGIRQINSAGAGATVTVSIFYHTY